MRFVTIATTMVMLVSPSLAYAQDADLHGSEKSLRRQVLDAFPSGPPMVSHEQHAQLLQAQERLRFAGRVYGQTDPQDPEEQEPDSEPAPPTGGGRFGGPLIWAIGIVAVSTVGFIYVSSSLHPAANVESP